MNHNDYLEISMQLADQDVLIEFIPHSPTSIAEGVFVKGKLNSNIRKNHETATSLTLKTFNSDIEVPFEDIKCISPL